MTPDSSINYPFARRSLPNQCEDPDPLHLEMVQEATDLQEEVRKHSWLGKAPLVKGVDVDFKLLSLLNGDAFIKGTPLEGYDQKETLKFFHPFLKGIGISLPPNVRGRLDDFATQVEGCSKIAERLSQIVEEGKGKREPEQNKLLKQYAQELAKSVEEKGVVWMPGGWSSKNGTNHALVYRIEKDKGITIFNSGGGLEFHQMAKVTKENQGKGTCHEEMRTQQFFSLAGVDKKRLLDPDFYLALIDLYIRPEWDGELNPDAKHVYKGLLNYLDGRETDALNPNQYPELFKKDQRSGTCTVRSITTALYYALTGVAEGSYKGIQEGVGAYKQLKFLWQFFALAEFCRNDSFEELFPEQLELLEDYCANLSRSTKKEPLKSWLVENPNYLRELNATLLDIQGKIDLAKKSPLQQPAEAESTFSLTASTSSIKEVSLLTSPLKHFTPQQSSSSQKERHYTEGYAINLLHNMLNEVKSGICPTKLLGTLQKFQSLVGGLRDCLIFLPVPKKGRDDIWSQVPEEHILRCMEEINKLMQEVVRGEGNRPQIAVLTYFLLAAQDKLARRLPESKLGGFNIYYLDLLAKAKEPEFILEDPRMQEMLEGVLGYFDPNFSFETLVSDTMPPSANYLFGFIGQPDGLDVTQKDLKQENNPTLNYLIQIGGDELETVANVYQNVDTRLPKGDALLLKNALMHAHQIFHEGNFFAFAGFNPFFTQEKQHATPKIITFKVRGNKQGWNSSNYEQKELYQIISEDQNKILPDTKMGKMAEEQFQIPLDELREFLMVGASNPYGEALQTLSFIKSHFTHLKNPDFQTLVRTHLFRPLRLKEQLKANPDLVKNLAAFVQAGMDHFFDTSDMKMCLYMAELGFDLKAQISKKERTQFPNVREWLYTRVIPEIKNKERSDGLVNDAYVTLLSAYKYIEITKGDKELLKEIAQDVFHFGTRRQKLWSPLYKGLLFHLEQGFASVDGLANSVCQTLLKETFPNAREKSFRKVSQFSPFHFTNGEFEVDFYRGDLRRVGEERVDELPAWIEGDLVFRSLCSSDLGRICVLGQDLYFLPKHNLKVMGSDTTALSFAKELREGQWYSYAWGVEKKIKEHCPSLVEEGMHFWINEEQTEIVAMRGDQEIFVVRGRKTSEEKMTETVRWDRIKHSDDTDSEEDRDDSAYRAPREVFTKQSQLSFEIESIVKDNQEWIPFDDTLPAMKILNTIEKDTDNIQCWGTNKQIKQIALTRYGLHFQERGGKAYSTEYPGFFLSPNQQVSSIPKEVQPLCLENSGGVRKVLVQRAPLKVTFAKPTVSRQISKKTDWPVKDWIEFQEVNGQLQAKGVESRLYLLHLHLVKGEYRQAHSLLQKIHAIDRFNAKEREVLGWIIDSLKQDNHPHAYALLLTLVVKIRDNHLQFPLAIEQTEEPIFTYKDIAQAILGYEDNASNATLCFLDEEEEKKVMRTLRVLLIDAIEHGNEEEKEIAEQLLIYFDQFFETRKAYLETGKAKLGVRQIAFPDMSQPPGQVDVEKLFLSFKDYRDHPSDAKDKIAFDGFIFGREKIAEKFSSYYYVAREGTIEEKEQLKKLLIMNQKVVSEDDAPYLDRLLAVVKNPKKYTEFSKCQEAIEAIEKATRECEKSCPIPFVRGHALKPNQLNLKRKLEQDRDRTIAKEKKIFQQFVESGFTTRMKKIAAFVKRIFSILGFVFTSARDSLTSFFSKTYTRKGKVSQESAPLGFQDGGAESIKARDLEQETALANLMNRYFEKREGASSEKPSLSIPVPERASTLVKEKIKKENADLDAFLETLQPEDTFAVKEGKCIEELKGELQGKVQTTQQQLSIYRITLLCQANRTPREEQRAIAARLGSRRTLEWEEVRQLFLEGDFARFQEQTNLTKEQAKALFTGVANYMLQATRLKQMEQVLRLIGQWEKADSEEKKDLVLQGVVKMLLCQRSYHPDDAHREATFASERAKLCFELANGYLYRENQLKKLDELIALGEVYPELLAQMPTGWGKTKTAVPTLDDYMAKSRKLIVNLWPAAIEITNSHDVQGQMDLSFGRLVDRLVFDRSTAFESESLAHLWEVLQKNKSKGVPINARPESIRSLELHYLLTVYQLADREEMETKEWEIAELQKQVDYLSKILLAFREEAWATVDEAHANFDPFDKLIYTLGQAEKIPDYQVEIVQMLFEGLMEFKESSLDLSQNNQQMVSVEEYEKVIAPQMAKYFSQKLKIDKENKDTFTHFVLGVEQTAIPEWIENHPERDKIALVKGLLAHVLKASLEGAVDEDFGFSKKHRATKGYAIPYAGSNTPKETEVSPSQFKNPHETLVKTFIAYLYRGIQLPQVQQLVKHLQAEVEKAETNNLPLDQCSGFVAYRSFFGEEGPTKPLKSLQEEDVEKLAKKLEHNRLAIYYYVRHLIAPQVQIFPKNLTSTAQNFRSQLGQTLSLTATPPDVVSHGPDTYFVEMQGISGQVSYLLLSKGEEWQEINQILPQKVLEETNHANFDGERRATIDVGGLYRGIPNRTVAEEMKRAVLQQEKRETIKGIVFFDEESERFKILYVDQPEPKDLEECGLDPDERFTYYDQGRSVGSDIKQGINAVARVHMGKETTKAMAGQAVGRMRQIFQEQGLVWVVQEPVAKAIKELYGSDTLKREEAVGYMVANQSETGAKTTCEALRQQMDNVTRNTLLVKLLKSKKPWELLLRVEDEFITKESIDPYLMYALISRSCDSKTCLKDYYTLCKKHLERIQLLSSAEKAKVLKELEKIDRTCQDPETIVPEKVKSPMIETGMNVDILAQVSAQEKVNEKVAVQAQDGLEIRRPWGWSDEIKLFEDNWIKVERVALFSRLSVQFKSMTRAVTRSVKSFILTPSYLISEEGQNRSTPYKVMRAVMWYFFVALPGLALFPITIPLACWIFRKKEEAPLKPIESGKTCPLYRVSDVLGLHLPSDVREASTFFSRDLLVSNNYFAERGGREWQAPFTMEQKPLFEVLVIEEEGKFQVVLVDQHDSAYFHKRLRQDQDQDRRKQDPIAGRKRRIALYDLRDGVVVQGRNGFSAEELQENQAFQELLIQAKLMNGEVHFTDEELRILKGRLDDKNRSVMGRFIEQQAVKCHSINRKMFSATKLAKVLGRDREESKFVKANKQREHLKKNPLRDKPLKGKVLRGLERQLLLKV